MSWTSYDFHMFVVAAFCGMYKKLQHAMLALVLIALTLTLSHLYTLLSLSFCHNNVVALLTNFAL